MTRGGFTRDERRILVVVSLLLAVRVLGLTLVLPGFRAHASTLTSQVLLAGIALGAYGLTMALSQVPSGALSDRLGRRPVLFGGLAFFAIGSFVSAAADSIGLLIAGRLIQGMGAVVGAAYALMGDAVAVERRAVAMGIAGFVTGAAAVGGLVVGGPLAALVGLRALFVGGGVLALVLLLVSWPLVPVGSRPERQGPPASPAGRAEPAVAGLAVAGLVANGSLAAMLFVLPGIDGDVGGDLWVRLAPYVLLGAAASLLFARSADRGAGVAVLAGSLALLAVSSVVLLGFGGESRAALAGGTAAFFLSYSTLAAVLPTLATRVGPAASRGAVLGTYATGTNVGSFAGGVVAGLLAGVPKALAFVLGAAALAGLPLLVPIARSLHRGGKVFEGDRTSSPVPSPAARSPMRRFHLLAIAVAVAAYLQIVLGAVVRASGSGLGCGDDWPLCHGELVPLFDVPTFIEWFHRLFASVVSILVVWLAVAGFRLRKTEPALFVLSEAALVLVLVQVVLGGLTVIFMLHGFWSASHLAVATLFFAVTVVTAILAWQRRPRAEADAGSPASRPLSGVLRDYVALLKPRILSLLLLAGLAAMLVAGGRALSGGLVLWTMLGGMLAAGAANAFNMYLDRDIDLVMVRTKERPLPSGRLSPRRALAFGFVLAAASMALLATFVNPLTALLAAGGILFYVFVYTEWLKRSSPQNIVIGGAAGGFPALVGWAAVQNDVSVASILLGLLVFLWTPPHFWALALVYKDDYARASVPMLPVVRGERETKRQMLVYALLLVAASLLLYYPLGTLGPVYLVLAVALGAYFVYLCVRVLGDETTKTSWRLFKFSIVYLIALYGAMIADRFVPFSWI
ncbi:MAG: heme o synthase [Methanobacteriota archaeon]